MLEGGGSLRDGENWESEYVTVTKSTIACHSHNMSRSQATVRFFVAGAVEAKHREPFQSFRIHDDFLCIGKVSPKYMIHVYCNTLLGKV